MADQTDQLIPTLAMTRDPRLRRLFAVCGRALWREELDYKVHDQLWDSLMTLAPEFVPPEDEEFLEEWHDMVWALLDQEDDDG